MLSPPSLSSQAQKQKMSRPIPLQSPLMIADVATMETEAQHPMICPPVGQNSLPPSMSQEIMITATAEAQEAEGSEIVNSVNPLGGH